MHANLAAIDRRNIHNNSFDRPFPGEARGGIDPFLRIGRKSGNVKIQLSAFRTDKESE
jgi:hypothetical protein